MFENRVHSLHVTNYNLRYYSWIARTIRRIHAFNSKKRNFLVYMAARFCNTINNRLERFRGIYGRLLFSLFPLIACSTNRFINFSSNGNTA